jgi:secreted trypsin-like serine protease
MMSQNRSTGDSGTCYGDSGGPTFWYTEDGTEYNVAVTSWGDYQCIATGFAYRIDIPSSLDFIYSVMAMVD